jgi:hypothetical protein
MQRLSLFGCNANDVAKQSFVIIQRSQCMAGAASSGILRALNVCTLKDIPAAAAHRDDSP